MAAPAPRGEAGWNIDTSVPAVVLKMHHGSLGIARSLGRLGVAVHGLTAARDAPAAASRYWRACYPWNLEEQPPQRSLEYLLELGRRLGNRPLLIPVSDRTTLFVAEHSEVLGETFRFPRLPLGIVEGLSNKREMYLLARRLGIATAETTFPQSRRAVIAALGRTRFPVVLKGIDGARLKARTGRTLAIARSAAELLELYDRMEDPAGPNLMLQEYIPGGEDSVWMFNGYFNQTGECSIGLTGKKIRQNPVYTGSTSLGVCLRNDTVAAVTCAFMKAVGYRGILDIGYRYDARDGEYKVLDVNPRIGSSFRLFVGESGLDVVRALYCDMTGQPVPRTEAVEGRKWMVENQDIYSSYRYWQDGRLGLMEWLASFRGLQEGAWFAWDDLRPFWTMSSAFAVSSARSAARKLSLRPRSVTAS